jgi:peptidoglycan/LPS O-acetylase OafA/YrhL
VFFTNDFVGILNLYMVIASIMILFSAKITLSHFLQKITYWLGLSSYLIYLLHLQLGMAIILQLQSRLSDNMFIITGLAAALITLISCLLAIFVESPLQRFSNRIFRHVYEKL